VDNFVSPAYEAHVFLATNLDSLEKSGFLCRITTNMAKRVGLVPIRTVPLVEVQRLLGSNNDPTLFFAWEMLVHHFVLRIEMTIRPFVLDWI